MKTNVSNKKLHWKFENIFRQMKMETQHAKSHENAAKAVLRGEWIVIKEYSKRTSTT